MGFDTIEINLVIDVVDDDEDVVAFVVVFSQNPSIKSLVKIGSVIDEMLLLMFLLLLLLLLLFMWWMVV